MKEKVICNECGWCGDINKILVAPNPFKVGHEVEACPKCKTINAPFIPTSACEEPECENLVARGFREKRCKEHMDGTSAA